MLPNKTPKTRAAVVWALTLALCGALCPLTARADNASELESLRKQSDQMSEKIEQATTSYQNAAAEVSTIEEMIAENEGRTAEIEEQLPEQRQKAAASIKTLYMFQQSTPGLLELILSSESFNEFITTVRYIDTIHQRNTDEIDRFNRLNNELSQARSELETQHEVAAQKQDEALAALEQARAAKRELQQRADAIAAAEARQRAEAVAAAQKAIEEARQKREQEEAQKKQQQEQEQANKEEEQPAPSEPEAKDEGTFTTSSGYTAVVEVPQEDMTSVSTEPLASNTTDQETGDWAARIDAYLAGSPLAGYGATFAKAAATYGVDPRFSPAISCIESGKGAICFRPHNAWGWGSSSWGSWEEAINDHVAGLASGYGGTLTLEGAMRYCPPTYQEWYSSVLAEMNSI